MPRGSGRGSLNRYEIRAPFDGMIIEKHISLGEAVKEDTSIFTLSDLSTVWAEIVVSAKNLPAIRLGERVRVKASAFDSERRATFLSSAPCSDRKREQRRHA